MTIDTLFAADGSRSRTCRACECRVKLPSPRRCGFVPGNGFVPGGAQRPGGAATGRSSDREEQRPGGAATGRSATVGKHDGKPRQPPAVELRPAGTPEVRGARVTLSNRPDVPLGRLLPAQWNIGAALRATQVSMDRAGEMRCRQKVTKMPAPVRGTRNYFEVK